MMHRCLKPRFLSLSFLIGITHGKVEDVRPPNVIVFLTDDHGYADVGFQGFPDSADVVTPNMDRLAASGIIFRNGYVANATCGPSRASIMTGRTSSRFGVEENDPHHIVPADEIYIPQLIKGKGYVSGSIGKWHVGSGPQDAIKRGFDFRYGNDSGSGDYFMKNTDDPPVWKSGERTPRAYGRYITDAYMDQASRFILENKDRPFFLYLAFNAPHSPFQVYEDQVKTVIEARPQWKPAYERMKDQGRFPAYVFTDRWEEGADQEILRLVYITMLMKADEAMGHVLDVLEQEGLRENTLIFFLSDNGAALNRPIDLGGVNKPLRDGKGTVFDGGVRVPYVMSWPSVLPAGITSELVVSSMDIYSTTVELAGAKIPTDRIVDGVNLIPFLTGEKEGPAHESLFFRRFQRNNWAIRAGDFKYVGGHRVRKPDGALYNIQENLGEDIDLSDQFPERKSALQALYNERTKDLPVPTTLEP
jgi:arylsulfatase A-like enzyme